MSSVVVLSLAPVGKGRTREKEGRRKSAFRCCNHDNELVRWDGGERGKFETRLGIENGCFFDLEVDHL